MECYPCIDVCKKNGCEFGLYYCDELFVAAKQYFTNPFHMNQRGADEYSKIIANKLNGYYIKDK